MTIICSGSLAFDRLMSYPAVFADSIIPDQLDRLNISFVTDTLKLAHGGTAGNIAYNLGLLGEKPLIAGCLGDDPDGADYLKRLEAQGFPLQGVKVHHGSATAGCTLAADRNNNQINFFHPGAMNLPSGFDPGTLPAPHDQHLAIISPGGAEEMKSLCAAYRRLGVRFILDPGQQVPMFSGQELRDMLDGSFMLICNEYEYELFRRATGLSTEQIFQSTQVIVVTKGDNGSELMVPSRGSQHISPVRARQVVDPTGAGDAFRAGLIKGLVRGEQLVTACRLGAVVAAFCVEVTGTQEQRFTLNDVAARYAATFQEQISLD